MRVVCAMTFAWLLAPPSLAQEAPTGYHYAARPTDTGYSGSVTSGGAYAISVPLELPEARDRLPIPLDIVHGRYGLGAAGLNWDVPLSFLRRDRTLAHRRPGFGADVFPAAPERVSISLYGRTIDLVRRENEWVARDGAPQLLAQELPNGDWSVQDGNGLVYRFSQPAQLRNAGLWLLKAVTSANGAQLELTYQLNDWPIDGTNAVELNLTAIAYNRHPIAPCFKDTIVLAYSTPAANPLSISLFGEVALIRKRTLTGVDISSRAGCTTTPQRLRRYTMAYDTDPDTRLPRLASVKMFGRQGTAEENVGLPVASYEYGTATRAGIPNFTRVLRYARTQTLSLPVEADRAKLSGTALEPVGGDPGSRYNMWQTLLDVTGDGRPELVFKQNNNLWMAYNRPAAGGNTTLGVLQGSVGVRQLSDATFGDRPLAMHMATSPRYSTTGQNTVEVWRQAIDVNADGRIDVIDAGEMANAWVVYLNTPGGSTGVIWQRRLLSTTKLAQDLAAAGHSLTSNQVALSRRSSGRNNKAVVCWRWNDPAGQWAVAPLNSCPQSTFPVPDDQLRERTFVEWELNDLNGDGYPDFAFNSTPVLSRTDPAATSPPRLPASEDERRALRSQPFLKRETLIPFGPASANRVRASLNMAGARFGADLTRPTFTRSVDMQVASANVGVGAWEAMDITPTLKGQQMAAGFADVNGDGVADRVANARAYLGVFHGTARFYSRISIALPGPAAIQRNEHPEACPAPNTAKFASETVAGLRDLTGDGIPDYFNRNSVSIGTGVSFAPAIAIEGAPDGFSLQEETCDGKVSNTMRGLFDIDGDGKPEMLVLDDEVVAVYQLAAGTQVRTPEAGRLSAVDNGYGAKTQITYISAKEDVGSGHGIPSPEIVVTAVKTTGAQGPLGESRFAYGGAELVFDSSRDRFVFPGYLKRVSLRLYGNAARPQGMAVVSDHWPLLSFNTTMTKAERWLRARRVGLLRDTFTLRGSGETNPWRLLGVDAQDARVIGVAHRDWDAKYFEATQAPGANALDCVEMTAPYDFEQSILSSMPTGADMCRSYGFVFPRQVESWYGSQPPPSTSNVQTRSRALEVDDFGRTTLLRLDNDVRLSDDDVCVETVYASHVGNTARKLTSPASRRVTDCTRRITYASEAYNYDGLPTGQVAKGRTTALTVDRRATDNGASLGTIKTFEAEYDAIGNPVAMRSQRDAHTRTTRLTYDEFGLVTVGTRVEATGVPAMTTAMTYDPVSLLPVASTDINGTESGSAYDGLGRPIRETLRAPGGQSGVVSTATYQGFEGGPQGRRIAQKEFADPLPPEQAATAPGTSSVAFFDELGRPLRTEIALGVDYQDATLVAGARNYDLMGRVSFVADTYASGANPATLYGTTYHFNSTGHIDCIIRGAGPQPLDRTTSVAAERFPTCFTQLTIDGKSIVEARHAASLNAGSPQADIVWRVVSSAIGRELERSTVKQNVRLDHMTFGYDRLGQLNRTTRYLNPVAPALPVDTTRRLDSTGQVLRLTEPDVAPVDFAYSNWGEMTETAWLDGTTMRKIVNDYDGLGRLTSAREFLGSLEDNEARRTFQYDEGLSPSPLVTPTFTLGRMSGASAASGQIAFSYDAFGNIAAQVHTDRDGVAYIERSSLSANGQLGALQFNLPDQAYASEVAKYDYDSARRLRSVTFSDSSGTRELYRSGAVDPLGRIRTARFGENTTYRADYALGGRSLLNNVEVRSASGARRFGAITYDALARRVISTEFKDGAATGRTTGMLYDPVNSLAGAIEIENNAIASTIRFRYDALGNLVEQTDVQGNADVSATYGPADRDRLCFLMYSAGPISTSAPCNVRYDAAGNTIEMPTGAGSRRLTYFNSGAVRAISQQSSGTAAPLVTAVFAYDAFGEVREVDVQGVDAAGGARSDRRFGPHIEKRSVMGSPGGLIVRNVPGPQGLMASKRGADWIFAFGEQRGARFFVDQEGRFVQEVAYRPFGAALSMGAPAGSANHSTRQWNGSDTLAAFGLSHLGARLYDPVIGRFLSRDPIVIPRAARTTNPYAFALNDPFNLSDPSGLDPEEEEEENSPGLFGLWRDYTPLGHKAGYLKLGLWLQHGGPMFGSHYHPPATLSGLSHLYKTNDALQSWMDVANNPTGENKGYALFSTAKAVSAHFGFWGNVVSTGIDLGLVFHRRGWGWTPWSNAEAAQENWDRISFKLHLVNSDLQEIKKLLQDRRLIERTTCREATACWREGEEPEYDYDGYDPLATKVPFGPVWQHVPAASPVQPLAPAQPQSSGSFFNPLSGVDWGTISITEDEPYGEGPLR